MKRSSQARICRRVLPVSVGIGGVRKFSTPKEPQAAKNVFDLPGRLARRRPSIASSLDWRGVVRPRTGLRHPMGQLDGSDAGGRLVGCRNWRFAVDRVHDPRRFCVSRDNRILRGVAVSNAPFQLIRFEAGERTGYICGCFPCLSGPWGIFYRRASVWAARGRHFQTFPLIKTMTSTRLRP
jgi:hypothetical protein